MVISSDNNKVSFLHRVLDNLADEHEAMDEIISKDLMHQMEKLVEVMGGLRDEILELEESDRVVAQELIQRIDGMRELQDMSDDPEAMGNVLENIEALVHAITPDYGYDVTPASVSKPKKNKHTD